MGCGLSRPRSKSVPSTPPSAPPSTSPPSAHPPPYYTTYTYTRTPSFPPPPPPPPPPSSGPQQPRFRSAADEKKAVREALTNQYLAEVRQSLRCDTGMSGLARLRRQYWKLFYWEDVFRGPEHNDRYFPIADDETSDHPHDHDMPKTNNEKGPKIL